MKDMIRVIFAKNKLRNYQYLLMSRVNICIDPYDGEQILDSLGRNENIDILINTHQHFDHIRGNQLIIESGAQLKDRSSQSIEIDDQFVLKRVPTPGHTDDSDSFLLYKSNELVAIFGGDTIFVGGVGNCYNGGDAPTLAKTIQSFNELLDEKTIIYPGHDYWQANSSFALKHFSLDKDLVQAISNKENKEYTTWGEEKKHNPFVKVLFDESFRQKFFPGIHPREAFCKIREMRDKH